MGLSPAKDNRFSVEDLTKNVLVVQAHASGTSTGNNGDPYTWMRCTVAVISGPVSDELAEKAGTNELPIVLEDVRIQAVGFTSRLEGLVGKYDEDGTPKLVMGVVMKYKNSKGGTSFSLNGDDLTDAQQNTAIRYVNDNPDVFPEKDPFADSKASKAFA